MNSAETDLEFRGSRAYAESKGIFQDIRDSRQKLQQVPQGPYILVAAIKVIVSFKLDIKDMPWTACIWNKLVGLTY